MDGTLDGDEESTEGLHIFPKIKKKNSFNNVATESSYTSALIIVHPNREISPTMITGTEVAQWPFFHAFLNPN